MYSLNDLIEAFTPNQEAPRPNILVKNPHKEKLDIDRAIKEMQAGTNWHDNMVRVVGAMVQQGNSDNMIMGLAQAWTLEGYTANDTLQEVQTAINGARKKGFAPRPAGQLVTMPPNQWPTPYKNFDGKALPKRKWIYGRHYIRGYVSVLASAGGIGKTSLQVAEALAIASGRDLLGEKVCEQTNVWLMNLEDPMEEMQLRIVAAMQSHNVRQGEIEGRLFVDAGRDFRLQVATQSQNGFSINEELKIAMIEKITTHKIGAVFIDPFVGSHAVNENDNMAINAVVDVFRQVADATNCAIGLVHHTRKANGQDSNIDSVRGAGSLIGAARVARVANKISQQDAAKLGICEKTAPSVFRVENGKANMSPPAEASVWRIVRSHCLENGEYVGVVHAFTPPTIKAATVIELETAVAAIKNSERPVRCQETSNDWAGYTISGKLNLDIGGAKKNDRTHAQELDRLRVRNILTNLESSGAIVREKIYDSRNARDVEIYKVNDEHEWGKFPQSAK